VIQAVVSCVLKSQLDRQHVAVDCTECCVRNECGQEQMTFLKFALKQSKSSVLEEEFHHKFQYSSMHWLYLRAMLHDVTSYCCTGCYKLPAVIHDQAS